MFCYKAICGQMLNLAAEQMVCPIVDYVCNSDDHSVLRGSEGIRD
jgi:hypothetical protein